MVVMLRFKMNGIEKTTLGDSGQKIAKEATRGSMRGRGLSMRWSVAHTRSRVDLTRGRVARDGQMETG
jgi:hypothetical protein